MKPDQEARRGDAYGLSLFDFQLSTLNCLTRIRRNKARMSMKTKNEVKKSRSRAVSGIDPPLTRLATLATLSPRERAFDRVRLLQPSFTDRET